MRLKALIAVLPILLLNFHWVDWNVVENLEDHSHSYRVFEHNLDQQEIVPLGKESVITQPKISIRSISRMLPDAKVESTDCLTVFTFPSEFDPIRINPEISNIPPPSI